MGQKETLHALQISPVIQHLHVIWKTQAEPSSTAYLFIKNGIAQSGKMTVLPQNQEPGGGEE